MDYDDIDYFPRKGKRAERADAAKGEHTKHHNLEALRTSGLKFHEVNNGDVAVFRSSGKPTVDFFTRKNRWQVRGQKKTTHGAVGEFIAFISGFHNLEVLQDGTPVRWVRGDQNMTRMPLTLPAHVHDEPGDLGDGGVE